MLLKCSECSETWNKAIQFFSPLWPPPTLDILPGCRPRPHVLTFVKISKNTQMNFSYHTESVSQQFKPIKKDLKKCWKKINYFPWRGDGGPPFAENSAKINNLIFEPFPYKLATSSSFPPCSDYCLFLLCNIHFYVSTGVLLRPLPWLRLESQFWRNNLAW